MKKMGNTYCSNATSWLWRWQRVIEYTQLLIIRMYRSNMCSLVANYLDNSLITKILYDVMESLAILCKMTWYHMIITKLFIMKITKHTIRKLGSTIGGNSMSFSSNNAFKKLLIVLVNGVNLHFGRELDLHLLFELCLRVTWFSSTLCEVAEITFDREGWSYFFIA